MSQFIDSLKYKIKRLPRNKKFIGGGSLLVIISVIMPWYRDLDAWSVGNNFSALEGPLYLLGYLILLSGIASGVIMWGREVWRKNWKFPVLDSLIQIALSLAIVFFLIIANSVFFHKDFGVNILRKETRFGMFLAFIGAVIIGAGAYFENKQEESNTRHLSNENIDTARPLIDLNQRANRPALRKTVNENPEKSPEDLNLRLNI